MIPRRNLLAAIGASSLLAGLPAFAQSGKVWRIGFVYGRSRADLVETGRHDAFVQGMREVGYAEGRDYVIEYRFAEGDTSRIPPMMAELVGAKVDLIVSTATQISTALRKLNAVIPVVITAEADPVGNGFAASLARPGGAMTGFSTSTAEIVQKHPELLKAAAPRINRIAVLRNPTNVAHGPMLRTVDEAAKRVGLSIVPVEAHSALDIERGFGTLRRERADALITLIDLFFVNQRKQICDLATRQRVPAIFPQVEFAAAGALMVYGQDQMINYRRAAVFIDKIFKGAKPGELPFEQPTKFDLILNKVTAKAIGLSFPQELLLRADKVIE